MTVRMYNQSIEAPHTDHQYWSNYSFIKIDIDEKNFKMCCMINLSTKDPKAMYIPKNYRFSMLQL